MEPLLIGPERLAATLWRLAATLWPLCVETVNTTHKRLGPAACLVGRSDQARDMRLRCNTVSESRVTRGGPVSWIKAAPILIGRSRMTATCWPLRRGPPTDNLCVGTFRTTRLRMLSDG